MITEAEILKGRITRAEMPPEHIANLDILLDRMNKVRTLYGVAMTITSGYRSNAEQIRVYAAKGITDIKKIPMGSKHLICAAVDVADTDGKLNQWCKDNEEALREIGVWLETRQGGWQHFQVLPYGSYNPKKTIFFNP